MSTVVLKAMAGKFGDYGLCSSHDDPSVDDSTVDADGVSSPELLSQGLPRVVGSQEGMWLKLLSKHIHTLLNKQQTVIINLYIYPRGVSNKTFISSVLLFVF